MTDKQAHAALGQLPALLSIEQQMTF